MRGLIVLTALMAGSAAAKPGPEYAAIAAAGGETLLMDKVPVFQSGRFRLGTDGTTGTVRRRSRGAGYGTTSVDPDPRDDRYGLGEVERRGTLRFALDGPAARGAMTGDCGFDRLERQATFGGLRIADPTVPLALVCRFTADGAPSGALRLEGAVGTPRTERVGEVRYGGTVLTIRSLHRVAPGGFRSDLPIGYAFSTGGRDVGAVDLNAATRRRLVLPADPAQRAAVLAAGVTLGLFWDPGDTDD